MGEEHLRACRGGYFLQRYGLQPSGGVVNDGEDVEVAICCYRERTNQIHLHVAESPLRYGDGLDGCSTAAGCFVTSAS